MKRFLFLPWLCLLALLAGCPGTMPLAPTATKNVFVAVPDELIVKCEFAIPPDKVTYVASDAQAKEKQLTDYSVSQTTNLRNCSGTVESIRDWNNKNKAVYNK